MTEEKVSEKQLKYFGEKAGLNKDMSMDEAKAKITTYQESRGPQSQSQGNNTLSPVPSPATHSFKNYSIDSKLLDDMEINEIKEFTFTFRVKREK